MPSPTANRSIQRVDLPPGAQLAAYRDAGAYTDCYATDLPRPVSLAAYVDAFYTTPLFKLERWILARFARRPSTDFQARQLAVGQLDAFAAWRVEARGPHQILLCDLTGRTRSWLMVAAAAAEPAPGGGAGEPLTRLYFGSAVVPLAGAAPGTQGARRMGLVFRALLGFHKLYSRALLFSARRRLAS